jgi:hypothetical protein
MTYAGSSIAVRVSTAITIAFAMVSLTPTTGSAETRRVVVRVYDTGIGDVDDVALRTKAIRTAASIVEMAGVFVEWYDCTDNGRRPVCQDARRSGNFIARIMPTLTSTAPLRKLSVAALGAQGDAEPPLGFAVVDPDTHAGKMATVFHDQVQAVARRTGVARSELLGRALAHEVGHLLLGVRGHSRNGIMRAVWTDDELTRDRSDDWVFASADRQKLQQVFIED